MTWGHKSFRHWRRQSQVWCLGTYIQWCLIDSGHWQNHYSVVEGWGSAKHMEIWGWNSYDLMLLLFWDDHRRHYFRIWWGIWWRNHILHQLSAPRENKNSYVFLTFLLISSYCQHTNDTLYYAEHRGQGLSLRPTYWWVVCLGPWIWSGCWIWS